MIKTLLWVDDDISSIRSIVEQLQRVSTVKIDFAADASTAITKIVAAQYDLVVVDVIMPAGPIEDDFQFLNPHFDSYQYNGGFGLLSVVFSNDWQRLCGDRPRPLFVVSSAYPRLDEEQIIKMNLDTLKIVERHDALEFLGALVTHNAPISHTELNDAPPIAKANDPTESTASIMLREKLHEIERGARDTLNHLSRAAQFFYLEGDVRRGDHSGLSLLREYVDVLTRFVDRMVDHQDDGRLLDLYEACLTSLQRYSHSFGTKEVQFILSEMRRLIENPVRGRKVPSEMNELQGHLVSKYFEFRDLYVSEILASAKQIAAAMLTKLNRELLGARVAPLTEASLVTEHFRPWQSIERIAKMMEPSALQGRIEIKFIPDNTELEITAIKALFEEVIENILDNAIKYSGQMRTSNAWIDIIQSRQDEHIVITIKNWGNPIEHNEKTRIIKHGERGIKAGKPGFGIGLAIVDQNVRLLGGSLTIQTKRVGRHPDAVGRGPFAINRFEVRFPIRKVEQIEHS
jgi:signal transduction histidine kinase